MFIITKISIIFNYGSSIIKGYIVGTKVVISKLASVNPRNPKSLSEVTMNVNISEHHLFGQTYGQTDGQKCEQTTLSPIIFSETSSQS